MNIAILIPTLSNGGAERVAAEISKYFSRKGHNIYIFTEQQKSAEYDFAGKIVRLKCNGSYYSDYQSWPGIARSLWKRASEVRTLKKRYKIDVAISFMELYNLVNVLSKTTERVIVRVCTVLSLRNYTAKLYTPGLIGFLYNRADCVVTISHYGMRDMVRKYGVRKDKIKTIPNSVETASNTKSDDKWIYGDNAILCLARVSEVKQQGLLIDIFSRIKKQIPDAKLLLVGADTDEYATLLKRKVREMYGKDDIIFTGHINNTRYYLMHSKLFVLLSKVEGFGNATIEAMAMGVPVVCMDSPGAAREILAPHTKMVDLKAVEYAEYGILVPFIDETSPAIEDERKKEIISEEIVKIMGNQFVLDRYAESSRKRAAFFTIERVGKMWDKTIGGSYVRNFRR